MTRTELKSIRAILQNEQAAVSLSPDEARLHEAAAALRRIGKGTYGICVDCGEKISPHLLAAEPCIAYCTTCQDATLAERSAPVRWFDFSSRSTGRNLSSAAS